MNEGQKEEGIEGENKVSQTDDKESRKEKRETERKRKEQWYKK